MNNIPPRFGAVAYFKDIKAGKDLLRANQDPETPVAFVEFSQRDGSNILQTQGYIATGQPDVAALRAYGSLIGKQPSADAPELSPSAQDGRNALINSFLNWAGTLSGVTIDREVFSVKGDALEGYRF